MNLRNVTIGTTAVVLFLTTAVPVLLFCGGFLRSGNDGTMASIVIATLLWLFSAPLLIVSLIVALKLKYNSPVVVILVTTIVYGMIYVFGWSVQWFVTSRDTGIWFLGVLSLPVMFPAWIAALWLNSYYVKKTPDPGTAVTNSSLNGT